MSNPQGPSTKEAGSGCPVNHQSRSAASPQQCPVDHAAMKNMAGSEGGKCPVDHSKWSKTELQGFSKTFSGKTIEGAASAQPAAAAMPPSPPAPGCTSESDSGNAAALNPRNMMVPENQRPSPGQRMPLPTHRITSSIPKGKVQEEEGNWVYPSPQMFYNAMKRKGYEAKEEDMSNIVAIHNAVNERTWMEIMKWEQHHFKTCPQPKLQRFRGRPNDLSVKAQWRTMTGAQPPFDRHDWVVDRCGTEVRYIIDYYTGKAPRETVAPSFFLDVRPALDRPGAFLERGAQLFRDAWSNVKKMWSV